MIGDLDNQEQQVIKGKVRLTDKRGMDIFTRHMDVHIGPPIGSWVEFLGIRIALRTVRSNDFDGIVPDFLDVVRNLEIHSGVVTSEGVVTSDQGETNDTNTEIDNS